MLKHVSIKRKLVFINLLVMGAGMLIIGAAVVFDHYTAMRSTLLHDLNLQAKIIAGNSTAAVAFNDQRSAQEMLMSLKAVPNIRYAAISTGAGALFAEYRREERADGFTGGSAVSRQLVAAGRMAASQPIILQGETLGTVRIESDLQPLHGAVMREAGVTVTVLGAVFAVASLLLSRAQRAITGPLLDLAGIMRRVSGDKAYSIRAEVRTRDEVGSLAQGFNEMLEQIQKRDEALEQHRAHLEQEVAQRTASLTEAQRIAHLGSWEWDIVNNKLHWSDEMYRIFGLNPQQFEANYEAFLHAVHPEDRQAVDANVRGALEKRHAYDIGYRIALPDGAIRFAHAQGEVSFDPGGRPMKMQGTVQDVTDDKLAEEQIRKQQALTTQIIETIPMRIFWKDRTLHYLGCNTVFARDAGKKSPGELLGKDDFEMGWKEQAELYRADDKRVMDTDTSKLSYDEPQTTPAGERIWLRTSKVPLHNDANEVIGVLGTYEDITERKNTELALRESEERFRMAFQNSAIGMALVGVEGRWLKVNDALCRIVGYPEQELLRKTFQDITHPDDLQGSLDAMAQLLAGKIGHCQMEKRYRHKDGHAIWISLSVSLVRDAQGKPLYFVSQVEDITADKQVAEKIRKLNEELELKVQERTRQLLEAQEALVRKGKLAVLGQVAGSVGHELRNPLGVMNNAVYFLQEVLSDADGSVKEYLGIIRDEIANAERIVSDLLDSVRTKPPRPEAAGVAQLVEQTLGKCAIPPSVTVKLDIPAALAPLRVDPMQISQVFRNLISNGVDAMPEGGTLEIRAAENAAEKTIHVSVRDSGVGMTPEQLDRLFQPLFTTKARGIGLGLVVVKNLTEANGGTVEVASEAGKGTMFTLSLPASHPPEEA